MNNKTIRLAEKGQFKAENSIKNISYYQSGIQDAFYQAGIIIEK